MQTHASTLRLLESKNIELNDFEAGTEGSRVSWVSMIPFVQQSLHQHDLSLCGNLSDRWDGVGRIHDPGDFSFGQPMENAPREALASSITSRIS